MSIKKVRLPDNSEYTLDAELLGGYDAQKYYPAVAHNFINGCFCQTSLSSTANTVLYIEIVGRDHSTSGVLFNTQANSFYINGAFNSARTKAVRYGGSLGNITFCVYEGKICFWFKVAVSYCTFYVTCRTGSDGRNCVTAITNMELPAEATSTYTIAPAVAFAGTYLSASSPAAGITATDITNWNSTPSFYSGSSDPASSLGSDGDIYIQTS